MHSTKSAIAVDGRPYQLVLSADARSGPEGFDIYRQAVAPLFDAVLEDQEGSGFSVHVDCVQFGPMLLSRARMLDADYRYDRSLKTIARVGTDALLVQIILAGSDVRMVKGGEIVSRPGDIFLCDLTRPLKTKTAGCGNFTFAVPRSLLGLSDIDLDGLHDIHLPAGSTEAKLLLAHISLLWNDRHRLGSDQAGMFAESTAGLIASLTARNVDRAVGHSHIARAEVTRVQKFIDLHLSDPHLGPEMICARLGLSRSALYRLFDPFCGVAHHIRDRRLRRAFRAIADQGNRGRKVGEIAFEFGFTSVPTFNRAFKSVYGVTPSEIKASSKGRDGWSAEHGATTAPDAVRLRSWLDELGRE